jgi:hypothetical protein
VIQTWSKSDEFARTCTKSDESARSRAVVSSSSFELLSGHGKGPHPFNVSRSWTTTWNDGSGGAAQNSGFHPLVTGASQVARFSLSSFLSPMSDVVVSGYFAYWGGLIKLALTELVVWLHIEQGWWLRWLRAAIELAVMMAPLIFNVHKQSEAVIACILPPRASISQNSPHSSLSCFSLWHVGHRWLFACYNTCPKWGRRE